MNRQMAAPGAALRQDLQIIADMIAPNSRVLDVGCGDGALLDHLAREKQVDGRGIELSQDGVNACVARGLSVIQGDADTDLNNYPSGAFDYVVLGNTLQATRNPRGVLAEAFRGTNVRFCVISFTSDWLFPTVESRQVVHALNAVAANVSFVEVATDKGHDAFLLDEPELHKTMAGFIDGAARHRGLGNP